MLKVLKDIQKELQIRSRYYTDEELEQHPIKYVLHLMRANEKRLVNIRGILEKYLEVEE